VMELSSTFISDDNPNKDINVAFFNIPFSMRYFFTFFQYNIPLFLLFLLTGLMNP
jgi:hypothetical protein